MTSLQQQQPTGAFGSLDGDGAGDHDHPYRFGWRPRASAPYPRAPLQRGFNTRQYARLLVFRGRLQDRLADEDPADGTGSLAAAA